MLTEELYFDYVIRFRGNIAVTAAGGETRSAAAWVRAGGRARVLRDAAVTADRYPVATVVCIQDPDMKQAWCLAASGTDATAKQLTGLHGRRWGIECTLRDTKDLRFGMGLGTIHVNSAERRDRLWLINAFAVVLLTLLGAAGEALGYDRMLKTSTVKRRVHSLFRQGCMLLRSTADHARCLAAPADAALLPNAAGATALRRRFWTRLMNEGILEGSPTTGA